MDIRVLRFCEAVARQGSFTKAAEEIHIAQPALSMAIAKLEEELGAKLFFRYSRGAAPTPEGEALLQRAARIFEELDSARREIRDNSELSSGSIRVGFPPMYGLYYLPKLLMEFHARYPGINIKAEEGSATAIHEKLEEGSIDLGILESRRVDRKWNSVIIGKDEMVLGVNTRHPLATKRTVSPEDLEGLPVVLLTESFLQRQMFDQICEANRVQCRRVMECNFVPMTVMAALEGHGASTLLASLVSSQPGLVGLSFEPKLHFTFELCWRKDRYFSKANQALVTFAKTHHPK